MNNEYLLTPVIEVEDGRELMSYRMYYLYAFGLFFGLLPVLVLCIRNCIWLRVKRSIIISLAIISALCLAIQFYILGSFFAANKAYLLKVPDTSEKINIQQLLEEKNNILEQTREIIEQYQYKIQWEKYKRNLRILDKACALLLVSAVYLIARRKYKVAAHLTGNIQPMLKWGIICAVGSIILQNIVSSIFFGGTL